MQPVDSTELQGVAGGADNPFAQFWAWLWGDSGGGAGRTGRPLRLEELGARVLPSAVPLLPVPHASDALVSHTMPPTLLHPLAGHGSGSYSVGRIIPDLGTTFNLKGTADLAALGHVSVTGSVHSLGFIATGHAGGELTFSNGKGTVTVELTGPQQGGFSALPQKFAYRVVSGTGAYAHLSDHGSLTLVLTPAPVGGLGGLHGTFTLKV
jgi:hypothetical protein